MLPTFMPPKLPSDYSDGPEQQLHQMWKDALFGQGKHITSSGKVEVVDIDIRNYA